MGEVVQQETILKARLQQFRVEYLRYIEKNIDAIDANVPVFFGQMTAAIDRTLPNLPDGAHDQLMDVLTEKMIKSLDKDDTRTHADKVLEYSQRMKKCPPGSMISDILLAFRLLDNDMYTEAAGLLRKYQALDAVILPAIAYCYYTLSAQRAKPGQDTAAALPNEMMLLAREHMVELVRLNPPVNRLHDNEMIEDEPVTKIFWFMLNLGIEWFPKEPGFLRIGIVKARKDGDSEIRERLLITATERFCDDRDFLRELYRFRLEKRDVAGISGVIRQMTQQYPLEIEPVYYGLRFSIITGRSETYTRFRKMAVARNIPVIILMLLDFAFEIRSDRQVESLACMEELRRTLGPSHYYVTLLGHILNDAFSNDETRMKKAKRVLYDSIDQYCMTLLKIPDD